MRSFAKRIQEILNASEFESKDFSVSVKDLGMDSLDRVEFVMNLEKEFKISLDNDIATEMEEWPLHKIVDFVSKHGT